MISIAKSVDIMSEQGHHESIHLAMLSLTWADAKVGDDLKSPFAELADHSFLKRERYVRTYYSEYRIFDCPV